MRNFLDAADYAQWKRRCIKQRYIAAKNPCYEEAMATCVDFEIPCGPEWYLRLVLETFVLPGPIWHASISHIRQIGNEVVFDKITGLPIFEAPQDALICPKDWTHEEKDIASSLLGDLMGPLIAGKTQRVFIHIEPMALHWITPLEEVNKHLAQRD